MALRDVNLAEGLTTDARGVNLAAFERLDSTSEFREMMALLSDTAVGHVYRRHIQMTSSAMHWNILSHPAYERLTEPKSGGSSSNC